MYEYYKLNPQQRQELVKKRLQQGFPSHSPPHPLQLQTYYLLTATCYQHQSILANSSRRQQLLNLILGKFINNGFKITAWVILANHYHLLVNVLDFKLLSPIFKAIHGFTSYQWNLEDNQQRRKVWYRFADRAIRSERHYYTTLNYIHYNPVKHKYVNSAYDWQESSVHLYLEKYGREWLRDSWLKYPIRDYGKEWDD
jgi:putative transposase